MPPRLKPLAKRLVTFARWFANVFVNLRIALAYPAYERRCRNDWIAAAEMACSPEALHEQIQRLMQAPLAEAGRTYDEPIKNISLKRNNIDQVVADAIAKLRIFERNYSGELDSAYASLNQLKKELEACKASLNDAYVELEWAKTELNRWYARAERSWFGNGGRELPKKSFFGQDLSDRDNLKSRRDSAGDEIARIKQERNRITNAIEGTKTTIGRIKNDRQAMFDLKKEGYERHFLTKVIHDGENDSLALKMESTRLADAREKFIYSAKSTLGVFDLESRIQQLKEEKEARIRAFDSTAEREKRKARHRSEWPSGRAKAQPSRS